jgi:hypothetical protein
MRIAVTTPEVLKALQQRQRGLPYADRVKPFNFVLSPVIDAFGGHPQGTTRGEFTLIAPFTSDSSRWYDLDWVNLYEDDGTVYRLARPGQRRPSDAEAKTYGDVVKEYRWHEEAKSLGPDGRPCADTTAGLLQRMPVRAAAEFRHIGKETDRRWEREDDISLLNPRLVEYRPQETAKLTTDPTLRQRAHQHSIREISTAADVTAKPVKALRRGRRIRKSTARKIEQGLNLLDARARQSKRKPRRPKPSRRRSDIR